LEIALNITECIACTTVHVCASIGATITIAVTGRALSISSLAQALVEG